MIWSVSMLGNGRGTAVEVSALMGIIDSPAIRNSVVRELLASSL
jgi:hypothetical protein